MKNTQDYSTCDPMVIKGHMKAIESYRAGGSDET